MTELVAIPGYKVRDIKFDKNKSSVHFYLDRVSMSFRCPCGKAKDTYWDCAEFTVRDLGYGIWRNAHLVFSKYRVNCDVCGVQTETLDWLGPYKRYTNRLAEAVAFACREVRSISAISESFSLDWKTVKEIDKEALKQRLDPPDFTGVERIAVDEIAIEKGQKYATSVIDFDKHRILWVSRGRAKESLDEFYEKLGKSGCKKLKAVAMDMWDPYKQSTREHTDADIVYDPFHVLQNFSKVIDKVRNEEAKKAKETSKKTTRS